MLPLGTCQLALHFLRLPTGSWWEAEATGLAFAPFGEREKPLLYFHPNVLWRLGVADVGEESGIACYGV